MRMKKKTTDNQSFYMKVTEVMEIKGRGTCAYGIIKQGEINVGDNPVRFRCEFTSDLPNEMNWIPEVNNYQELKELLENS